MIARSKINLGEGERIEAGRRRLFWSTLAMIGLSGGVVGFVTGFSSVGDQFSLGKALASIPKGALIAMVTLGLVSFSYGCWRFLKVIDEVELADNLWASTSGFYAYAVLLPTWWALWKGGLAGEPSDWVIFFASLASGGIAYVWKKWRAR